MESGAAFLKKWAEDYLRHKDIFDRKIMEIEEKKDGLVVTFSDKRILVVPEPELETVEINQLVPSMIIVTYNTEKNFKYLVESWKEWIEVQDLTIIFVNPLSEAEIKWIIQPSVHNRVAEAESLVRGLKALYEVVDTLPEEAIPTVEDAYNKA